MAQQETNKVDLYLCKEGVFGTTPPAAVSGTDIAANNTAGVYKFTSATANKFINLAVGQLIKTLGFTEAANNGDFRISAKNAAHTEITVDGATVTEAAGDAVTVTPYWVQLRFTGHSLKRNQATEMSETIRDDRMRDDAAEVGVDTNGAINAELAFLKNGNFLSGLGMLLEGALETVHTSWFTTTGAGSADNYKLDGTTITAPVATVAQFAIGQWIRVSGSVGAGNDGIYKITAKPTTATMTVSKPLTSGWSAFTTEDSSQATLKGQMMRNGILQSNFSFEERLTDISKYCHWKGQRPSGFALALTAKQRITLAVNFMGKDEVPEATAITLVDSDADANPILTASAHIGDILEGGSILTNAIRSVTLNLTNNSRLKEKLGSKYPFEIGSGFCDVTGSAEVFLEDLTLFNKAINRTATSLVIPITDASGNTMIFSIPNCKLKGDKAVAGGNQDLMLKLEIEGLRDSTTSCVFQVDLLAA